MTNRPTSYGQTGNGHALNQPERNRSETAVPTQIFLQPIASPAILGLFAFGVATFIVAADLVQWYTAGTGAGLFLLALAAAIAGVVEFLAGMWAFKARDGLATAFHGMWGAFWVVYGILFMFVATGNLVVATGAFPALGFWFIALAVVSFFLMVASSTQNTSLVIVTALLAAGAALGAAFYLTPGYPLQLAAGYALVISAIVAWYTAGALMLDQMFGRPILPLGKLPRKFNRPRIVFGAGEAGVVRGEGDTGFAREAGVARREP